MSVGQGKRSTVILHWSGKETKKKVAGRGNYLERNETEEAEFRISELERALI
jgi:hypothetical protein